MTSAMTAAPTARWRGATQFMSATRALLCPVRSAARSRKRVYARLRRAVAKPSEVVRCRHGTAKDSFLSASGTEFWAVPDQRCTTSRSALRASRYVLHHIRDTSLRLRGRSLCHHPAEEALRAHDQHDEHGQ